MRTQTREALEPIEASSVVPWMPARPPAVLRTPQGGAALGVPENERILGLLHQGHPRQEPRVPERAPATDVVR